MTSFISASIGLVLALAILGIAWSREADMVRALYQAALVGGFTTALGGYWFRQMVIAGLRKEKQRRDGEAAKAASAEPEGGTPQKPATR